MCLASPGITGCTAIKNREYVICLSIERLAVGFHGDLQFQDVTVLAEAERQAQQLPHVALFPF